MQEQATNLKYTSEQIFQNLKPYLTNPSAFHPQWEDGSYFFESIGYYQIVVVGAGGLGCQIVKNLALSGIRKIHLIDMDTIDLTNLNRQFLFRKDDVGKYKAEIVADFIHRRCPGVQVIPHRKRVQQMSFSFFQSCSIIIGGLDNIQARTYLNDIAHQLNLDSENTVCYYIDGATQGFEGQALLVQPFKTSCYQCSLLQGLQVLPKTNYCTLANTPRTPEHCIQYVMQKMWQEERKQEVRDNDNLQHMQWIYEKALARANQFKIQGVTEMLTLGTTKNIIPAIASTNAFIAAVLTNQTLKILSGIHPKLNNYMLFKGGSGIGSQTYSNKKRQNCKVCKMKENRLQKVFFQIQEYSTFQTMMQKVKHVYQYINRPFVNYHGEIFLNPLDAERYTDKCNSTFKELIESNKLKNQNPLVFYITDNCLKDELRVEVKIVNNMLIN